MLSNLAVAEAVYAFTIYSVFPVPLSSMAASLNLMQGSLLSKWLKLLRTALAEVFPESAVLTGNSLDCPALHMLRGCVMSSYAAFFAVPSSSMAAMPKSSLIKCNNRTTVVTIVTGIITSATCV